MPVTKPKWTLSRRASSYKNYLKKPYGPEFSSWHVHALQATPWRCTPTIPALGEEAGRGEDEKVRAEMGGSLGPMRDLASKHKVVGD